MVLRFLIFLIGTLTFGKVKFNGRFILSTGGIDPPKPIMRLIVLNLTLGLLNFAPIPPLDGGHAVQAILAAVGSHVHLPQIPGFVSVILFAVFYGSASNQNMRVLEAEPEEERDVSKRPTSRSPETGDDYPELAPLPPQRRRKISFLDDMKRWEKEGEKTDKAVLDFSLKLQPTLSIRVIHRLADSGITTIGQLRQHTREQLLNIKYLGPAALEEIEKTLSHWGLSLKPTE